MARPKLNIDEAQVEKLAAFLLEKPKDIWDWVYSKGLKDKFFGMAAQSGWSVMRLGSWLYVSHAIKQNIRSRIRGQVADHILQNFDAMSALPFTIDELIEHIDRQMTNDLNWDNISEWHIDHIKPKSSFKFKNFNDQAFKDCWALSNLRVYCKTKNLKKGSRLDG